MTPAMIGYWSEKATDAPVCEAGFYQTLSQFLRVAIEVGVLLMVCLSPWVFGGNQIVFKSVLYGTVAVLLGCWAVRILLKPELSWKKCPVVLVLVALILCATWQLAPLPRHWLSWLSPGTLRMYERLLPSQAEILPFGVTRETPYFSAGSTISLYPGRTVQELIRLLAVLLLFLIVRNNIASASSLYRLAVAAVVNGVFLSLFALIQFFTSPSNTLYWTWPTAGTVFGPFVCRNHFAFYLNLYVGLGVGLLLIPRYSGSGNTQGRRDLTPVDKAWPPRRALSPAGPRQSIRDTGGPAWPDGPLKLLHDPTKLWITVALALMISSVVVCASRGGIVALVSGWTVCLGIYSLRIRRFRQLGALLLTLSIGVALVSWLGFARVEARLATLWPDEIRKEGRLSLWNRTLALARDFPVWGTGYGTFQYVEPLCRNDPTDEEIYTNAENEYLEGFIEGGLVRLALSVLAIALVFQLGYRAVCRNAGSLHGSLAIGALFGFVTVVVQSCVDFGLHMPSIAVLATVVSAHLCALGSAPGLQVVSKRHGGKIHKTKRAEGFAHSANRTLNSGVYSLRLWGLAAIAGALLTVLFGLALGYEGWRTYRAQEYRQEALSACDSPNSAKYAHQVHCLAAAARLTPEYADLHIELALTHYDQYREQHLKLWIKDSLADAVQVVSALASVRSGILGADSVFTLAPAWLLTQAAREEVTKIHEKPVLRDYLVPALSCFLQARDLCPLLPDPQRILADNADKLERADTRVVYLERAARVVPFDPALWYVCGDELLDNQPREAWTCWRRSLALSDVYLPLVLEKSAAHLTPRELCDQVLPRDPNVLLKAALDLYPQPNPGREPLLDRALSLLEKRPSPLSAKELYLKASILCARERWEDALAAYQAALSLEPRQVGWRFELARLLYQQNRLRDARQELLLVVLQQPHNQDARTLLALVERKIAESM